MIALTINFIATEENLSALEDFHCNRCKGKLFRANHNYATMWTGAGYPGNRIPAGMGWTELKCRNCPTMYNFYYQ